MLEIVLVPKEMQERRKWYSVLTATSAGTSISMTGLVHTDDTLGATIQWASKNMEEPYVIIESKFMVISHGVLKN